MKVILPLPELYRDMKGKTKKRFAWEYIKKLHPEYDPDPNQELLFTENKFIMHLNVQRAHDRRKELAERKAESKKKKKR